MLSLVLIILSIATEISAGKTVLHCGNILNVTSGEWLRQQSVIVENGKIMRIRSGYENIPRAAVVNLKNAYVLPGLIDAHVHLTFLVDNNFYERIPTKNVEDYAFHSVKYARDTLNAGFTTVRDLGGLNGVNVALKNAVQKGLVEGPRMLTARQFLRITGGHGDFSNGLALELQKENTGIRAGICSGIESCRDAVRWQLKNGADLIKVTATGGVLTPNKDGIRPSFSQEELNAIVDTASDRGVHVAAHAHGLEGIRRAVIAGVKTVEHATYIDDDTLQLMKSRNTWLVPTLTASYATEENAKAGVYPLPVVRKIQQMGSVSYDMFKRAIASGVKIAFGTDSGVFPHALSAKEFELMVDCGMSSIDTIRSATINNAKMLQMDDVIGSIDNGKFADIIAVDQDALNDVKVLQKVQFVMKEGIIYKNKIRIAKETANDEL